MYGWVQDTNRDTHSAFGWIVLEIQMANKHLEKKLFNLTFKEERSKHPNRIHFQNENVQCWWRYSEMKQVFVALLAEDKLVRVSWKAIWQLCLENFKVMDTLWFRNSIPGNFPKLIISNVDQSHARRCSLQIFSFEKEQTIGQWPKLLTRASAM